MALIPPVPVGAMDRTSAVVSAGAQHVMAVKADGSLWGWGENSDGQLGDGTSVMGKVVTSPKKIMTNVKAVSAGGGVSAIIKTDNSLWMCGNGEYGAIGDGTTKVRATPVKVMDNVASVTTSGTNAFAIKTDGTLWGWGRNSDGMVGNGTTDNTGKNPILKPVKIMDGVASVSMGELGVNMAIKTDGSLWAWGNNGYYGLYGNGTRENKFTPVKVMEDVAFVSAGRYHAAVIKKDGSLWAWGDIGFLAQYTTVRESYTPVKILDNADADFIYSEYWYIAMIKKDKSLWLLGRDEAFGDKKQFEKIMDDVAVFDRGLGAKVVLKTDGSLWTWGGNIYGAIGDGKRTIVKWEGTGMAMREVVVEDHDRYSPYNVMKDVMRPPVPLTPIDTASGWAKESINKAVAAGFVPADLQDNYRRNITRGEFCRMAVTYIEARTEITIGAYLSEKGLSVDSSAFTDTQDVNILSAHALGIVSGKGNNAFAPNGPITREEAAVMLRNLQRALGHSVADFPGAGFDDSGKISVWAVEAVGYTNANGIMGGIGDNIFDPRGTYTREQAIITFLRIFEK